MNSNTPIPKINRAAIHTDSEPVRILIRHPDQSVTAIRTTRREIRRQVEAGRWVLRQFYDLILPGYVPPPPASVAAQTAVVKSASCPAPRKIIAEELRRQSRRRKWQHRLIELGEGL